MSCNSFFGSESTNWMCSSCFKYRLFQFRSSNPITSTPPPPPCSQPSTTTTPTPTAANRCHKCNKKVGLLGTDCKCSHTFCNMHRLPEDHDCPIDYRGIGKETLSKKVEKVASRKVSEIWGNGKGREGLAVIDLCIRGGKLSSLGV